MSEREQRKGDAPGNPSIPDCGLQPLNGIAAIQPLLPRSDDDNRRDEIPGWKPNELGPGDGTTVLVNLTSRADARRSRPGFEGDAHVPALRFHVLALLLEGALGSRFQGRRVHASPSATWISHARDQEIAPLSCLPILMGEGIVGQDSTQIINFLEQRFPDPS